MKYIIIILLFLSCLTTDAQYSTHRIYNYGENYQDTVLRKDNTDSLFRLFEGEYKFAGLIRTKVFVSATEIGNLSSLLSVYQPTLISGTNIKTVNNTSLLGSGNIAIVGGGEAFPVGSVFISVVATNPNTLLGYGTWEAFAPGRMLVGFDNTNPNFDAAEETGGSSSITITAANLPQLAVTVTDPGHTHLTQRYPTATGGSSGFTIDVSMTGTLADNTLPVKSNTTGITATANTGGANNSINILNPYITVFMWKRTN